MDFDLESGRDQYAESLNASFSNAPSTCSVIFYHPVPYNFGLPLHGLFIPLTSQTMSSSSLIEQPLSSQFGSSFSGEVRPNEPDDECLVAAASQMDRQCQDPTSNTNSDLSFDFAPQVKITPLYSIPENQDWSYNTATSDTIPNEFGLHSQAGAIVGTPLLSNFDQNTSNHMLDFDITREGIEFSGNLDTNLGVGSNSTELNVSFNGFDENTSNDNFDLGMPGQDLEASPKISSPSPEMSFSSSEFNPATPLRTPDPNPPSMPSGTTTSPSRQFCGLCRSTFKRPGDLKRHEKVHFPERRNFHCWQYGCERNGRRGFYRRDKLRDHEKQVHGL
jgi:hypothetical protein